MMIPLVLLASLSLQDPDSLPSQEELARRREAKLTAPFLRKAEWTTDYDVARARARKTGKLILVYFTRTFVP